MSIASPPPTSPHLAAESIYRIPIAHYERLVELGAFEGEERVELLQGMLILKMTKNPPHQVACDLCREALGDLLPRGYRLRIEGPIQIPDFSEPEPDLAVVRGETRDYARHHPGPADIVLVVEVADASLALDRSFKRDIYAQAGIPTYWIVNLPERRVEVFEKPRDGVFTETHTASEQESVELVVDGVAWGRVDVSSLLP